MSLDFTKGATRDITLVSTRDITLVSFLLDESGSMEAIKQDTIGGFNSYLRTLRNSENPNILFSFAKFDSNGIRKVCSGEPIEKVQNLSIFSYNPGAATPLIDASMEIISATEKLAAQHEGDKPKVIIVIQTDGEENCSKKYSFSQLADKVKEKTEKGWAFKFIGAGIDAFKQAEQMGIAKADSLSYGLHNSGVAFAAAAESTMRYVQTGNATESAFTEKERASVGEEELLKNIRK